MAAKLLKISINILILHLKWKYKVGLELQKHDMTGKMLPKIHKRVKDIGTISKRQFQRRIRNKIQLHNNSLTTATNFETQSLSQFNSITLLKSPNKQLHSTVTNINTTIEPCDSNTTPNFTNEFHTCIEYSAEPQPIDDILYVTNDNQDIEQDLVQQIRKWAVQFNVSHGCANKMLNILRNTGQKVPKDIRTILREYKAVRSISEIQNGSYLNLGICNIIQPHLLKQIHNITNNIPIKLSFSIDGLPLAKNSKTQFWPILMSFINLPIFKKKIFPVGIFHSFNGKPGNINEYLEPFINELNHILTHGIQINNKKINFEVAHIVADAPAKAFLLNVKNHNGYFACTSCEVEGDYLDRVCFLDVSAPLRTDNSFRLKLNAEYHKDGFSPLINLPIDIINCVVLDYMHCVCQGVMKRLLDFWVKGKKPIRMLGGKKRLNFFSFI
ncbi:uncharacterized protein LOC126554725 [Aphis gossypii]|uniref:uncharacterized protein LOC126554725 n=1 Tax=Aphis gossypii TaxID=80765 RepID=UPI002159185A|nr:uncharacterized protein LOC126554725 [Aphis gossypii]